jgi:quercetin dioxygenase-like cupin family protein
MRPARRALAVTSPTDEGGDPACWAHLYLDDEALAVDLTAALHHPGDGVHWTLEPDGDLNANLVRLDPGHEVAEHTNVEVDVLVIVLAGDGHAMVDGGRVGLAPQVVLHLPKGRRRSLHAGDDGLSYLTVHRRRGPLVIGSPPS